MQVIGSFLVTCPHFPETTTSKLWTSSWSLMISPIIILMYATLNDHSLGILLIVYFWNCLKYGKVFNFKLRFILHQECKEFFCLQGERLHLSFCSLFFLFFVDFVLLVYCWGNGPEVQAVLLLQQSTTLAWCNVSHLCSSLSWASRNHLKSR